MSPLNLSGRRLSVRLYILSVSVLILVSVMMWASAKVGWFGPITTSPQYVVHQRVVLDVAHAHGAVSQAPSDVTVETIALTHQGFQPNQIERGAGKFLLGIDNRIKPDEFSFEILMENGHKMYKLKLEKGQIRLRKLLNLPEGRYVLRAVDHPEWTCAIVLSK